MDPSPDNAVLFLTLTIAACSALLFGVGPALRSTAVDPACGLRAGNAGQIARLLLRRVLVVAQVSFSVVLIGPAGLFGHSLFALRSVDLGIGTQNVIAFSLDLPRVSLPNSEGPISQRNRVALFFAKVARWRPK